MPRYSYTGAWNLPCRIGGSPSRNLTGQAVLNVRAHPPFNAMMSMFVPLKLKNRYPQPFLNGVQNAILLLKKCVASNE